MCQVSAYKKNEIEAENDYMVSKAICLYAPASTKCGFGPEKRQTDLQRAHLPEKQGFLPEKLQEIHGCQQKKPQ